MKLDIAVISKIMNRCIIELYEDGELPRTDLVRCRSALIVDADDTLYDAAAN